MMEPTEIRDKGQTRRIGLSLLGSAIIWAIHLMIVYPLTSLACRWSIYDWTAGGLTGLKIVQLIATAVALVLVGGLWWNAYHEWTLTKQPDTSEEPEAFEERAERSPFLAFLALLLTSLFFLTIALAIVPILTLEQCGPGL